MSIDRNQHEAYVKVRAHAKEMKGTIGAHRYGDRESKIKPHGSTHFGNQLQGQSWPVRTPGSMDHLQV